MLANASLISCNFSNFPSLTPKSPDTRNLLHLQAQNLRPRIPFPETRTGFSILFRTQHHKTFVFPFQQTGLSQICHSTLNGPDPEDPVLKDGDSLESKVGESGNVADGRDWTTSILLFVLWGALLYYVFNLAPNQTPVLYNLYVFDFIDWTTSILLFVLWGALLYYVFNLAPNQTPTRDMYFLKKLLNLKGDDGFRMNDVLVSLWYIMGLWPLVYGKLLIPTGRSSKSNVVVWPFVVLSFFGGAYALLPYFVLWKPPPPPVEETELTRWPLNFLESKLTAGVSLAAGLGIITYAGLANGDDWKEFFQYFRESRFIHATCLDFTLLSAFAPFWVYNDMTARKWFDKGSWLLPLSLVPFLGPALYIILRPPLSPLPAKLCSTTSEPNNT